LLSLSGETGTPPESKSYKEIKIIKAHKAPTDNEQNENEQNENEQNEKEQNENKQNENKQTENDERVEILNLADTFKRIQEALDGSFKVLQKVMNERLSKHPCEESQKKNVKFETEKQVGKLLLDASMYQNQLKQKEIEMSRLVKENKALLKKCKLFHKITNYTMHK
jgi:hypothetical protein